VAPGEELVVCTVAAPPPSPTPPLVLGLSTCFDVRFPEMYAALARHGANAMLVPSAFTFRTGAAHWEVLLRARAIESQAWVLAAAQAGAHSAARESWGHALIVDPWGTVVSSTGAGVGVAVADVRVDHASRVRAEMPLKHVPHVYRNPPLRWEVVHSAEQRTAGPDGAAAPPVGAL
jgi:predicted amidohydrolase